MYALGDEWVADVQEKRVSPMGEGRGKLESLIAELEAKKAELQNLIQEYELMLPHLTKAREALDDAGITDVVHGAAAAPAPQVDVPTADAGEQAVDAEAQQADEAAPAAEEPEGAPARRSIASLVAEDEAAGDEATH